MNERENLAEILKKFNTNTPPKFPRKPLNNPRKSPILPPPETYLPTENNFKNMNKSRNAMPNTTARREKGPPLAPPIEKKEGFTLNKSRNYFETLPCFKPPAPPSAPPGLANISVLRSAEKAASGVVAKSNQQMASSPTTPATTAPAQPATASDLQTNAAAPAAFYKARTRNTSGWQPPSQSDTRKLQSNIPIGQGKQ